MRCFSMDLVLLVFYRYSSKDEPPRVLNEEEMNRLGARIVKAELMGDMVMSLKNCQCPGFAWDGDNFLLVAATVLCFELSMMN